MRTHVVANTHGVAIINATSLHAHGSWPSTTLRRRETVRDLAPTSSASALLALLARASLC